MSIPRAAPVRALRSAGDIVACVVHDAAPAKGTKTPKHATKHTAGANRPKLNLKLDPKSITTAFQFGFKKNERQNGSRFTSSWMQIRRFQAIDRI
jgi:hypothetical protein